MAPALADRNGEKVVGTTRINTIRQQTRMLTSDENIVVVDLVVQYQNADPVKYLFEVQDPDATLSDVSESAIREVIGKKSRRLCAAGGPRRNIAVETQELIQETLDEYGAGIHGHQGQSAGHEFPEPGRGGRSGCDQGARG